MLLYNKFTGGTRDLRWLIFLKDCWSVLAHLYLASKSVRNEAQKFPITVEKKEQPEMISCDLRLLSEEGARQATA